MSNKNLLLFGGISLVLIYLLVLIYFFNQNKNLKEYFGMLPPRAVYANQVIQTGPSVGDFVEIPGTFQSALSPIGGAGMVDYGAFIRYRKPSNDMLRTADYKNSTPLTYANSPVVITEKFCSGGCGKSYEGFCSSCSNCNPQGCRGTGELNSAIPLTFESAEADKRAKNVQYPYIISDKVAPPAYAAGNYAQLANSNQFNESTNILPAQKVQVVNALGNENVQPIIYDRYIYANQKQRTLFGADWLRGDLPIVPVKSEWFRPSSHANTDLRSGALAVMGGVNNSTSNELLALQHAASGSTLDIGSGINYSVQRSPFQSVGNGDIITTSFP